MKPFICLLVLAVAAVSGQRAGRQGRRQGSLRQGRQGSNGYGAPPPAEENLAGYGEPVADASSLAESQHDHQGLDWLLESVPGQPGEDYPILATVPDTGFSCDGQVEGGYYGDIDTECQAFHVCTQDGQGGLTKYSFLCPNGTIFNQGYFICDWWFNFDCAETESLYSLNDDVAAEREANSQPQGSASSNSNSYAAPANEQAQYQSDQIDTRQGRQGRRRFNN